MHNQLIPHPGGGRRAVEVAGTRLSRRVERRHAELEGATLLRAAAVRGEAIVASEKGDEIDYLVWKAMKGHADLVRWANHLAGDDIILADELRFFKDTARLGKGEIIADVIDTFRRL